MLTRLVVTQAVRAAAPGLLAGIVLATALSLAARSVLIGAGAVDLIAMAISITALVIVVVAGYLPSRDAVKTDPAAALR